MTNGINSEEPVTSVVLEEDFLQFLLNFNESNNEKDDFMESHLMNNNDENNDFSCSVHPFLKWAGGKYKMFNFITKNFPKKFNRYVEPFVGAGSVALNVKSDNVIINDYNNDLINVYIYLRDKGDDFISDCRDMFTVENNSRASFDKLKKEFNTTKSRYRKAVLFIYLNRHCFNGLCRYNGSGEFNVPFGKYDSPFFPEEYLKTASKRLQCFDIHSGSYEDILNECGEGDVVYCDPPYIPLSATSNFSEYSVGGFTLEDQIKLGRLSREAANRGATVLISNHYNWYSNQIYKKMFGAYIKTIDVQRTISSKVDKRECVKEVLAIFK